MGHTPPLDPKNYLWKAVSDKSSVWQRPALAGECMWIPRPKELRKIFVCSTLTLNSPISHRTFNARVKAAWRLLRFKVPELGVGTACGKDGKLFMQYHTPRSQEAEKWVDQTHYFQSGSDEQDLKGLRKALLAAKQSHHSHDAFLLCRADAKDGAGVVRHSQIMICIDHQVADGIGARIIFGQFLTLLASMLETAVDTVDAAIRWNESRSNLSQPWICCMDEHQVFSGPEYEATAATKRDILLNQMKHNPGLPVLQGPSPVKQETHFVTFPVEQTTALLRAIKHAIGLSSNITHLGHAAMVIALLRTYPTPLPTSQQTLHSPCWLNGRRYMRSTTAEPDPMKSYIPICQSFAPIVFPDLQDLTLSSSAQKKDIRDVLVKSCRIATAEYENIKLRKSMLPDTVALFEELGEGMARKNREVFSEQDTIDSASDSSTEPASPQTADPFFLSDGITEQYISHSYPAPLDHTPSPEPIFTVDNVQFAANGEKNLIVRMSSWRGKTSISGEWRGCDFDKGLIVGFLEDVVRVMFSIVDES